MEYILYITRFLYRIRWWLLLGTSIVTIIVSYLVLEMRGDFKVDATLYTGVASGYTPEGEGGGKFDWATAQNTMDNLMSIIRAESTLKRVSMRLYARCLINGDREEDNQYITAGHYRAMYDHLKGSKHGKEILALVDKKSEDKTVANFFQYLKPDKDNYLYGLFYYAHPHFSFTALKNIQVARKGSSDLLEINYSANDPGIAYNTVAILTKEFVNEYSSIRYGETDKVIEYFNEELKRIGKKLRLEEDSLTIYNVDKRIINYYDETKEIAAINKEYELREQDALFAYNSSKAMIEELEKHMDKNAKAALNNIQFINTIKEAATLTGKITEMETVANPNQSKENSLQSYKDRLNNVKVDLLGLADKYVENKYTKEGVAKKNIIEQWLDLTLQFEKAKTDLQIVQQSRQDLNERYAFYAPVGSTIKQKERSINFTEQNYLSILKSYNDALMRKKYLEMTSATLKVLNAPAFPISPESVARKKIVMAACGGTFLFILGFFLLLELLDRTLRDSIRARHLTGLPVLGAFPSAGSLRYRGYNKEITLIATKQLSSCILRFFTKRKEGLPYIINFISTEQGDGKSYLSEQVVNYWTSIGLKVRKLTWGKDFNIYSREYMLSKTIADLYKVGDEDIVLVEYPDLSEASIPQELIQEANLNLLVSSANRGWKEPDKLLTEKLQKQSEGTPLALYLNYAGRTVVQDYTGMLPPYTFMRKLIYRISQLALTESLISIRNRKSQRDTEEDD